MAEAFDGPWEIYQPPELDPQLEALAGKGAGLRTTLELLSQNPCHPDVGGYRLSGPLATVVCGAHLKRGYRIAYTTQPALTPDDRPRVVVLYVGEREPRHRTSSDLWDVVHDLFGVDNPPDGHHKPPCCQDEHPEIDHDALKDFRRALTQLNRPRRRRK